MASGRLGRSGAVMRGLLASALVLTSALPTAALDRLNVAVTGGDDDLRDAVRASSLLRQQNNDKLTDPDDLFAAARSDYGRILGTLYAAGYYGPTVSILIDGREASAIAPLDVPDRISRIDVVVDTGPRFVFGRAAIGPLARDTAIPEKFRTGETAEAGLIEQSVAASVLAWREIGRARATVGREDIVADHPRRQLDAQVVIEPGPELRFGPLRVSGHERMRLGRIEKIAGLPEGQRFSQTEMDRAANRLRRSGVFSSVSVSESDETLPGNVVPIDVQLAEMKTRRYSIGAEMATVEGFSLTGYWLHRNLLGGGERFKVDGDVTNIGGQNSGMDYSLGVSIDRPATITADTTASLSARIGHLDDEDYAGDYLKLGLSFTQHFSEQLTLSAGIDYSWIKGTDPAGDFEFRNLGLPLKATWDRRDSTTDARKGFYLDGEIKPFYGFGTTGSGARLRFDARGYRSFGAEDGVTAALRLQGGHVLGADVLETPRDDLFFSGGGGTVRGHAYRSLGVEVPDGSGGTFKVGGSSMVAASAELRSRITPSIGVVGFVDVGHVRGYGQSDTHAGAGLGLRYETGFGPIRFDVAAPVSGEKDGGVQMYIGLGQAF